MKRNIINISCFFLFMALLSSCGNSVTNVWDYYMKNNVEVHKVSGITSSKSKMLYRKNESSLCQLEFIAYRQDSSRYLIIGSHLVGKSFYINDSLYSFDVRSLYSRAKGNDMIRQMGDLSVYFTHVPGERVDDFLRDWTELRATYKTTKPGNDQTVYIDYALSGNVYMSFPKKGNRDNPSDCIVWVGRRKHEMTVSSLLKVMNEIKMFN